ncbi:molecular chaperone DnaK [mine drainage metagenome]|uniref:Molecular chaperone DnaK n=1 Tax=mine drainage metagenome TaxID=410659 RepID=T1AN91_9ZZZZ
MTIMEFGGGVFEVKSTSGDTQLGGTDMDNAIVEFLLGEIKKQNSVDISKDLQGMQRLREAAEKAKIELSTVLNSEINLPFLTQDANKNPVHFTYSLSRAKLESIVLPLVERSTKPVMQALKDAKLEPNGVDKVILVGGPTRMPIVQRYIEQLLGKKAERGVDPMEAVALGAAIQAGVLTGEVKDIVLLDVTPLTLGIETLGGVATHLIDRNTTIPVKKSQIFTTAENNQTQVDIHVVQGERALAKDNIDLGRFQLIGIPPSPRGVPQIEVTFDIDSNGILHVTAKDMASNKSQSMDIIAPHKMSKEDIDKKMDEWKKYEEEDKKIKENIEAKNAAESLVYTTESTLRDYKDKIPKDIYDKINGIKEDLDKAIKAEDYEGMKSKSEELGKALQEIGTSMYKGKGQGEEAGGPGPGPGPDESSGDSGAADADFKVEGNK